MPALLIIIAVIVAVYIALLVLAALAAMTAGVFATLASISDDLANAFGVGTAVGWFLIWSIIGAGAAALTAGLKLREHVPTTSLANFQTVVKSARAHFIIAGGVAVLCLVALPFMQQKSTHRDLWSYAVEQERAREAEQENREMSLFDSQAGSDRMNAQRLIVAFVIVLAIIIVLYLKGSITDNPGWM